MGLAATFRRRLLCRRSSTRAVPSSDSRALDQTAVLVRVFREVVAMNVGVANKRQTDNRLLQRHALGRHELRIEPGCGALIGRCRLEEGPRTDVLVAVLSIDAVKLCTRRLVARQKRHSLLQFQDQIALLSGVRYVWVSVRCPRNRSFAKASIGLHSYTQQTECPFCWFAFKSVNLAKGRNREPCRFGCS